MLLSAPSEKDKDEWILAFRAHQIDMFEARSKYFDRKLKSLGVLVPSASQLVAQGEGALNSEYTGEHEEQKQEDTGEMPRATFHYKWRGNMHSLFLFHIKLEVNYIYKVFII